MSRYLKLLLLILVAFIGRKASGQMADSAAIYIINKAFVITSTDTVDVSNRFVADTSALVIAKQDRDTSFFTIANMRGNQICIGEVLKESLVPTFGTITYSGTFVCNIGRVVTGNHFFITEIKSADSDGNDDFFVFDIVFDQQISIRFFTDKLAGIVLHAPIAQSIKGP